jgi:acyl-CoA synthetase (NDP forming)
MEQKQFETDLDGLFRPASFAHVGASSRDQVGRYNYIAFMKKMKFRGKLYPVNPKHQEVLGLKCYSSLASIPEDVDLVVMSLRAPQCAEVLQEMPDGKVRFVIIHSSGFGEIGKNDLEQKIASLGREKGFRIIGPNCMGLYSRQGRVAFWDDQHEMADRPGSLGFISQSGGIAINMISAAKKVGVNFDKVISLGNQIDISINEVLQYMGEDESIRVIGAYVEDVKDGRTFQTKIKNISPHKPVLIWKGGLTEVGKVAAMSHTGALAGDEKVFLPAMRQAGAILVDTFPQMLRAMRLLQPPFPLPGERLAILCGGGGMTVNISDMFSDQPNVELPRLTPETQEKLQDLLPEENIYIKNPVDSGSTGFTKIDQILQAVGEDPHIESILIVVEVNYLSDFYSYKARGSVINEISELILNASAKIGKPIFINIMQLPDNREDYYHSRRLLIDKFNEEKIPWLDGSFKEVAETFNRLAGYSKYLKANR